MKFSWVPAGSKNVASSRLRAYKPCEYLQSKGVDCEIFNSKNKKNYSVVIFQKRFSRSDQNLALELRSNNTKVIFDICDNYFESHERIELSVLENFRSFVNLCDHITLSTTELSKFLHRPFSIIEDSQDAQNIRLKDLVLSSLSKLNLKLKGTDELIWFGNSGYPKNNVGVFGLRLIISELNQLAQLKKIRLSIVTDSKKRAVEATKGAKFPINFVKWNRDSFARYLLQAKVALIPFSDNSFNRVKSNNRVVTCLSHGVPVVATMIPSYYSFKEVIKAENWCENIKCYLDNPQLAKKDIFSGRKIISALYSDKIIADKWHCLVRTVSKV